MDESSGMSGSAALTAYVQDDNLERIDVRPSAHLDAHLRWSSPDSGLQLGVTLRGTSNGSFLNWSDASSSLRAAWRPRAWTEHEGLGVTVYPFDATDVHLGFIYPITWARTLRAARPTFAAMADLQREKWGVSAGVKGMLGFDEVQKENRTYVAPIAGLRVEATPWLRIEANGMLMSGEWAPGLAQQGVELPVDRGGFSARGLVHWGSPLQAVEDFSLYRADPRIFESLLVPGEEGDGASMSAEVTHAWIQLINPDVFGVGETVSSNAAALEALMRRGPLKVHALAAMRDLEFMLLPLPGLPAYSAMPEGTEQHAEWQARVGASWDFRSVGLTPGLVLSAVSPANYRYGGRTVLIYPDFAMWVLAPGDEPQTYLTAQAQLRWNPDPHLAVFAQVGLRRDPSYKIAQTDPLGIDQQTTLPTITLSSALLAQLRF